jgi:hypothetical protein
MQSHDVPLHSSPGPHGPQSTGAQPVPVSATPHSRDPQASALVLQRQVWSVSQTFPSGAHEPQLKGLPQPLSSVPHSLPPVHIVRGVHSHWWLPRSQTSGSVQPGRQVIIGAPQPGSCVPHSKPLSHVVLGVQTKTHCPPLLHDCPVGQVGPQLTTTPQFVVTVPHMRSSQ